MARAYADGAQQAGAKVRFLDVGQLAFNPLFQGYGAVQPLEPDLLAAQADISWAHHLVWVYPIWWGAMPALLKGFIDRVLLPGYAFKYRKGSSLWDKLLTGRSAELLVTMDSPPWYFRWVTRMPGHQQMKKAILEFCGIRPVQRQRRPAGAVGGEGAATGVAPGGAFRTGQAAPGTCYFVAFAVKACTAARPTAESSIGRDLGHAVAAHDAISDRSLLQTGGQESVFGPQRPDMHCQPGGMGLRDQRRGLAGHTVLHRHHQGLDWPHGVGVIDDLLQALGR
eukprot:gene7717-9883_t